MWPYPWTHVGTTSHLGHMDRVAATMPSQAHAGAAQEASDIGQWEGQDALLERPSSCNVKGGIPSSRRYLPTYIYLYKCYWHQGTPLYARAGIHLHLVHHLSIPGRLSVYEVVGDGWQLDVINAWVPFGNATEPFVQALAEAYRQMAMLGPTIIIGDMNAAPTQADQGGQATPQDQAVRDTVKMLGLVDLTANLEGQPSHFPHKMMGLATRRPSRAHAQHRTPARTTAQNTTPPGQTPTPDDKRAAKNKSKPRSPHSATAAVQMDLCAPGRVPNPRQLRNSRCPDGRVCARQ